MKYSIVMAYYNRKKHLEFTLKSIERSVIKDVEIIIVNDASTLPIEDMKDKFDLDIKIINIEEKDKWWSCPCIPYNMGFKEAKGDYIIIQNPECLHHGDILKSIDENIKENVYLSYFCYCITTTKTDKLFKYEYDSYTKHVKDIIYPFRSRVASMSPDGTLDGWYNHPTHRPKAYHFLTAISKKDLDELGGFDERYANGVAFDDDEFIDRIKRKGMKIKYVGDENLCAIHQFHAHQNYAEIGDVGAAIEHNRKIYNASRSSKEIKVNQGNK